MPGEGTVLILDSAAVKTRVAAHAGGRCVACRGPRSRAGAHGGRQYKPKGRPCRTVWLLGKHSRLSCSTTTAASMCVMVGSHAAQGNAMSKRLSPWPPRCPGPLGHPPRPSPSLVLVWRPFGTFFWPTGGGGDLRPRAKAVISDAQGGTRGVHGYGA